MSNIIKFPQQEQKTEFEKVQLNASSLLEDFQNAYLAKNIQKGYMQLLTQDGEKY